MALVYADDGSVYDDGQPSLEGRAPLQIEVNKLPVDNSPFPINDTVFDPTAFDMAASRLARGVKHTNPLPVADDRDIATNFFAGPSNSERPSYIMEPNLEEAQGGMRLPDSIYQDAGGGLFYKDTNASVPTVRRPGLLPVAQTPEGLKFAAPKLLDIVGNVMGNVGGKVLVKPGEMVLGSGIIRKTNNISPEIEQVLKNKFDDNYTIDLKPSTIAEGGFEATVIPKNLQGFAPYTKRVGRSEPHFYDPNIAELEVQDKGVQYLERTYPKLKASSGLTEKIKPLDDADIIYRGMSSGEYENFLKTGKIQSKGDYNLGKEQVGLTYWSTDVDTATHYASGFAPAKFKARPDAPAYVVAVKKPKEITKIQGTGDNEVGVNRAIGKNEVIKVWRGQPYAIEPSEVSIKPNRNGGFSEGSSTTGSPSLGWKEIKQPKLTKVDGNLFVAMSDTRNQVASQTAHQVEKNGFYSQLERSVKDAKIEKADANQWLGYLKNQPGVKSEEINYVLKDLPEGQISKAQLEDIVKQNKVELKETVLGEGLSKEDRYRMNKLDQESANRVLTDQEASELEELLRKQENVGIVPQYSQYQLPGAENYKETLLKLPNSGEKVETIEKSMNMNTKKIQALRDEMYGTSGTNEIRKEISRLQNENDVLNIQRKEANSNRYVAPHFEGQGKDLFAHMRTNERSIEGLKGTHIEELQSDWGQAVRDKGYKGEKEKLQPEFDKVEEKLMNSNDEKVLGQPKIEDVLKEAVDKKIINQQEAATYKRFTDIENEKPVPDMPFKKNWDEVLLKRALTDAVEKGHDFISWTPGEAQALRYPDELRKKVKRIEWINTDAAKGEKTVVARPTEGNEPTYMKIDKNGIVTDGPQKAKGQKISEVIGKDMARQILEQPEGKIDSKDFVMGAEGMKGYYDKMVVDKVNNIAKKYGSRTEVKEVSLGNQYGIDDNAKNGFWIYKNGKKTDIWFDKKEKALNYLEAHKESQPVHFLRLTPELKARVKEGFALHSQVPVLVPVDHDPFERKKKVTLTRVDHDPFSVGK